MTKNKEIWITGFALFALFFGAGNLILPPSLGVNAGDQWGWVFIGFASTAVIVPILGIFAYAKIQGTMDDLSKKIAPWFGGLFSMLMYLIAVTIPAPRTASVAHEIAIKPFWGTSPLLTSSLYFLLIFVFVINRSKIIRRIGKFLTPIIGLILLTMILLVFIDPSHEKLLKSGKAPLTTGILEGYQTFDAIGGVVIGAVVIASLKIQGNHSYKATRSLLTKAAVIAGIGLLFIYGGLIYAGAVLGASFSENASRVEILTSLSTRTLGTSGTTFLSLLVALACFTTAVGIVTGTSDYLKKFFDHSEKAYLITAFLSCFLGVVMGHFEVRFMIKAALPALMLIYPITIVLILLNGIPERFASPLIFRRVVLVTFLFSIPDFLGSLQISDFLKPITRWIPFSSYSLGWLVPAFLTFLGWNLWHLKKITESKPQVYRN